MLNSQLDRPLTWLTADGALFGLTMPARRRVGEVDMLENAGRNC